MSHNTSATLDQVPNPQAAQALGAYFGALRTELIEQGFDPSEAFGLIQPHAAYVIENSDVTIVREVSE